jgi:hypothetical protein
LRKTCSVKADTLLRLQSWFEVAQTRKLEKSIRIQRISSDH